MTAETTSGAAPEGPPQRRGWTDFDPHASWIGVAWGSTPAYALVAQMRADAYAVVNRLVVIDRIAGYGPDPATADLYDIAEGCAYAWHAGDGWAWWLVSAKHVRPVDVDRLKARQRREWSESAAPDVPDVLPPALEPVRYRRVPRVVAV